ncbi:MAG TPA: endolytic transglycosylase MltG [Longimicrobiales bacterium]|nr:endolytic transglycosylase MltG [Longimicrobiales bacterium]
MTRTRESLTRRRISTCLVAWVGFLAAGCAGDDEGDGSPVEFTIPAGATFDEVTDTLVARGLVGSRTAFVLRARMAGADTGIRSGRYEVRMGIDPGPLLDILTSGRVETVAITIPEGFTVRQIAPRIAEVTGDTPDEVLEMIAADTAHLAWRVPGPGLEGYLFPETYRFAEGTSVERVVSELVGTYRDFWTPERRARLDSVGLTEREVVTLASIVEAEATYDDEMPMIASVYANRVRENWPLQADPTVLYALGGTRERLLFAMIDSVADDPYNTYTQPGLPPGPIGSPGEAALAAALSPAESDYFYFVADAEGRHIFSRTLAEHNAAAAEYRRRMFDEPGTRPEAP